MSNIPSNLKYTKSHEWVRLEADGSVTVGITEHAQDLLGDMVFVENPVVGRQLAAGEECAVVESVKAASDVYAPIAGEVLAANADVEASPESINQDAYAAWHATQAGTIKAMAQDLARYYFGPRADEARWQDLARALNLNDSIQPSLGSVSLQDACASLPAALARPRYEFGKLLTESAAPEVAVTSPRSGIPGTQSEPAPTAVPSAQ